MTVPRWGRITPSQGAMLRLAGHILDPLDPDRQPSDVERLDAICKGRQELKRLTGVDHRYDLKAWNDYLLAGDFGYDHPYAWRGVRQAIESATREPDRERLLTMLTTTNEGKCDGSGA